MKNIFDILGIKFDGNGNTTISKEKLKNLIEHSKLGTLYPEDDIDSCNGLLLIDKQSRDFFPFPEEQLPEWEKDGSCEPGDVLYKMTFIKKY